MYPRTLFTRSGVATAKARVLVTASVTARSTIWPALASPDVFSNDATSTRSGPLAATVPVRRNGTTPASHAATPNVATATAAASPRRAPDASPRRDGPARPARRHRVPRPSRRPSETARQDRERVRGRRRTRGPAAGPSAPPTTTCAGPHDGARAPRAGSAPLPGRSLSARGTAARRARRCRCATSGQRRPGPRVRGRAAFPQASRAVG